MFSGKEGFKKPNNSLFIWLLFCSAFHHAASGSPDLSQPAKSNVRCYRFFLDQDKLLELWEKADELEERINDLAKTHPLRGRVMRFSNYVEQVIDGTTRIFPLGYEMLNAEADTLNRLLQDRQSNLSEISIDEAGPELFFVQRHFISDSEIALNEAEQTEKRHKDNSKVISDKSSFEQVITNPTLLKPSIKYNLDLPPGPIRQVVFSDKIAKALAGKNKASRFLSQYTVSFLRAIGRGLVGGNGDNGIKRLKGNDKLYEVKLIGRSRGRLRLVGFLHESTFYIVEYFKDSNHSGKAFQSILESIKRKADAFSNGALPVVH